MTETLAERLREVLFSAPELPAFQVVYDPQGLLREFVAAAAGSGECRVVQVRSSARPEEMLQREAIANDFNDEVGWYAHKWLVHVYGPHAGEVEEMGSFQFYSRVGATVNFNDFLNLLLHPKVGVATRGHVPVLPLDDPEVGQRVCRALLHWPVACYVGPKGDFLEAAAWAGLLRAMNAERDPGPPGQDGAVEPKPIDVSTLVVELLRYEPDALDAVPPRFPRDLYDLLFKFLSLTLLGFDGAFAGATPGAKLESLALRLFRDPHPPEKASSGSLEAHVGKGAAAAEGRSLERNTQKKILIEWSGSPDEQLRRQFRYWAGRVRQTMKTREIKPGQISSFGKRWDATGALDLQLGSALIQQQVAEPLGAGAWRKKVGEVTKNRKASWKQAIAWWGDVPLFEHQGKTLTLQQFWRFVEALGLLCPPAVAPGSSWDALQGPAWQAAREEFRVGHHAAREVLAGEPLADAILRATDKLTGAYEEQHPQYEESFADFYFGALRGQPEKFQARVARQLWDDATQALREGNPVALVFCDGLRRDLAERLKLGLEQWARRQAKSTIQEAEVQAHLTYGLLPSVTPAGWTAILANDGNVVFQASSSPGGKTGLEFKVRTPQGDLVEVKTRPQREARIHEILSKSGRQVRVETCAGQSLQLDAIREAIAQWREDPSGEVPVPVVWFEEIDRHERKEETFAKELHGLLKALADVITKLHRTGIETLVVFTDHGFVFLGNEDAIAEGEKPRGSLHKRYAVSTQSFSEGDRQKYPAWHLFRPEDYGVEVVPQEGQDLTVVVPRALKLFRRPGGDKLFVHGGASFEELELYFLTSRCKLFPVVTPEFVVEDHEVVAEAVYLLKDAGGHQRSFEVRVRAKEVAGEGTGGKVRPVTLIARLQQEDVTVQPTSAKLSSKKPCKFTFYVPETVSIEAIKCKFTDSMGRVFTREWKVSSPAVGELF